ncbi:MAG: hypothetical protein EOO36_13700 [Cytophagaceae bacterium]|nr:MAG: hypothetical protein EOO36_13700 [Cytophagaceae bacterium]
MTLVFRFCLPLLLLGLLASCSVYDRVFHPHRLPTPDVMSPAAKARFRAAEKARHKGMVLKSEEAPTSATDPNAPAGSEAKKDGKLTYSELPEGTKAKYDKEGLLKGKPNLKRLQYHRYDTRPLTPNDVNRENRRLRKHPKGTDNGKDAGNLAPKERAAAPTADPAPTPEATPKPEKVKEPKEKKTKKAPVPKPDPTVEPGHN